MLRVYDLSTNKVVKAIRGLDGEVSSIICVKRPGSELRDAWIAHGRMISKFKLESPKMIQSLDDALVSLTVGEMEDDLVNQLALNGNKSHLAFGLDSGIVGLVDLSKKEVKKLQQKHDNICSSVQFIADRGNELVSAGYDHSIKHIDFTKDELIFGIKMGIRRKRNLILPTLRLVHRLLPLRRPRHRNRRRSLGIFFGGEKSTSAAPKKKPKTWQGLNTAEMLLIKVADGPIVAVAFSQARVLTISTMLGVITQYELLYDPQNAGGQALLRQVWKGDVKAIEKVNALLVDERRILVGGLAKDGKGIIEVWNLKKQEGTVAAIPADSTSQEKTSVGSKENEGETN
ncbi:hypothetical protein NMY22_g10794 [Coprinellus aureogranulatus]|nr:hypothetical protein NMY22_g10794 [Coprinellus aureogranulatus]